MAKRRIEKLTGSDARYGWKLGCNGFVSVREAAERLGKCHSTLCKWLKDDEGRRQVGHFAYPLRARRTETEQFNAPYEVCVRSIEEHKRIHQPVEV